MISEYYQKRPSLPGVMPERETHRLIAHGTIVVGTIYALDRSTATAATEWFATTSKAAPDAAVEGTQWVVALEAGGSGDEPLFGFKGTFDITADGSGYAADLELGVASGVLTAAAAADVIIATSLGAAVSAGTTVPHYFDGRGMGTRHA